MKTQTQNPKLKMIAIAVGCFLTLSIILIAIACANAQKSEPEVTKESLKTNATSIVTDLPVVKNPTIYDYLVLEKNESGYTLKEVIDYTDSVLLIPATTEDGEQINTIGDEAFSKCKDILEITIPATVSSIGNRCFVGASTLVAVNVEPSSASFCSVGGVLFTRDRSELICYPAAKIGSTYLLSTSVKRIAPYAFDGVFYLESIRYEGTTAKYQAIEIGSGNQAFTSLPVTCNYKAAK